MSTSWYYVRGNDRVGPVDESELSSLISEGTIDGESYVWTKGYDNWQKANEVEALDRYFNPPTSDDETKEFNLDNFQLEKSSEPDVIGNDFSWDDVGENDQVISIKVGLDRGGSEVEYGPYSIAQLKMAFDENRINGKTFVFVPGMKNWIFLAESPIYQKFTNELPPVIEETERRAHVRKPIVARLFFHDSSDVYEGVCRDISIGGLQVMVANLPIAMGDSVKLNVHPNNDDHCFTAEGEVVRILDGQQGFSLRFKGLSDSAAQSIESYIAGQ